MRRDAALLLLSMVHSAEAGALRSTDAAAAAEEDGGVGGGAAVQPQGQPLMDVLMQYSNFLLEVRWAAKLPSYATFGSYYVAMLV